MMTKRNENDLWVFGYGSLMWRPGFNYLEDRPARIWGWHRALCVRSIHYRGTPERPGLVLGLDRGGSCVGRAFRVAAEKTAEVKAYLIEREQITLVYCPRDIRTCLLDADRNNGRCVTAFTFTAHTAHEQYAGRLTIEETARIVAAGHGCRGANVDYVANTVEHLEGMGIRDRLLEGVLKKTRA